MSNPKDPVNKTLRESVESVIDESKVAEGKLPPWLDKKKKGKGDEEDVEEAKAKKSDDEADEDEEDMEEAKKVVKEEECSCEEDDDLPWCDDCEDEDEEEVNEEKIEIGNSEFRIHRITSGSNFSKFVVYHSPDGRKETMIGKYSTKDEAIAAAKKKAGVKEEAEPKKMKEHLAPLFDGQQLSEDFKTKAETIFGAVIAEREAAMKEHYETALAETIASTQSDLAEKVDEYLSYVVEEWYKENKIALERSLRAEIAENFMEGLRNLFTDNFITIPEEKVDVLEAANTKIDELTTQVNEEIKNGMEKAQRINELEATIAFSESIAGLTLSEVEKLKGLSESIEFDSVDEFKNKLNVLKETYLKKPVQETRDTLVEDSSASPDALLSPVMQAYTRTLSKFRN